MRLRKLKLLKLSYFPMSKSKGDFHINKGKIKVTCSFVPAIKWVYIIVMVKMLFFLSEWLNSLSWHGLSSSDLTGKVFLWDWGESIIQMRKVSVEDILDTERRQEDCLLAATGWIREKSQECWESIAFQARRQRRKEAKAFIERGNLYSSSHTHTELRVTAPHLSKSIQGYQNTLLQWCQNL